jgi:hypothetical protein
MELTIILAGVTRTFNVDADDIYNNDWTGVLSDMLDTVEKN